MTDFVDLLQGTFKRSEAAIRADWDARANAGLTSTDEEWVDTRVGGDFYNDTQPIVIEFASAYDRMRETLAASVIATSWGDALDAHAASYGEARLPAVQATGKVTFNGTNGTLVGTGVRVSPVQTDPEVEPPYFETTESGTIAGGLVTLAVRAVEAGLEGNLAANQITLLHSPLAGPGGQPVTSLTNAAATSGGEDVETDAALKQRLLLKFSGGGRGNKADYAQEVLRWRDPTTGARVGRVVVEPHYNGPGTVRVVVQDTAGSALTQAVVDALQDHLDPPRVKTTSSGSTASGAATVNVVSTAGFDASGTAKINDDEFAYTGVTATSFTGVTGVGAVHASGSRVVQGYGLGEGWAPINHEVTVATVTVKTVNVLATVEFKPGYSLDGTNGSVALRTAIANSVVGYIDGLLPGEDVIYNAVIGRIMAVEGVLDVNNTVRTQITTNPPTGTTDIAIAALEVARAGVVSANLLE